MIIFLEVYALVHYNIPIKTITLYRKVQISGALVSCQWQLFIIKNRIIRIVGQCRAVGAATVTTVLTVALFFGK